MRYRIIRILASSLLLAFCLGIGAMAASEPNVTAAAAVVMDYETGEILWSKDATTPRVPASMTKVMTAYILFEELEAGNINLDTHFFISNNAAQMSRNSAYPTAVPLPYGGTVDVDTLLQLILIPSASASCVVAAENIAGGEAAFVQRMNETAARLGMDADYQNCHGALPHYLSAEAQAILVREFISRFPAVLNYTSMTSMIYNGVTWNNTNKLLTSYYYEGCDGFKTGTIAAAGYCLSATAQREDHRLITVVMNSTDNDRRHRDSQAILDYGFAVLRERDAADSYLDSYRHWAVAEIRDFKALGVEMSVDTVGNFRPNDRTTRAEFVAMLVSALQKTGKLSTEQIQSHSFHDISGHWAEEYISIAAALGVVQGDGDGSFRPEDAISREEVLVIVDNVWELPVATASIFTDQEQVADWATVAVERGAACGVIRGYEDGSFRPQDPITRAETVTILHRLVYSTLEFRNVVFAVA